MQMQTQITVKSLLESACRELQVKLKSCRLSKSIEDRNFFNVLIEITPKSLHLIDQIFIYPTEDRKKSGLHRTFFLYGFRVDVLSSKSYSNVQLRVEINNSDIQSKYLKLISGGITKPNNLMDL